MCTFPVPNQTNATGIWDDVLTVSYLTGNLATVGSIPTPITCTVALGDLVTNQGDSYFVQTLAQTNDYLPRECTLSYMALALHST